MNRFELIHKIASTDCKGCKKIYEERLKQLDKIDSQSKSRSSTICDCGRKGSHECNEEMRTASKSRSSTICDCGRKGSHECNEEMRTASKSKTKSEESQ
jgi:hypothetical protein